MFSESNSLTGKQVRDLGNGEQATYQHDALGRLTGQTTEYGARYQHGYDARDRRVSTELSDWERSYQYSSLYDGRQDKFVGNEFARA